MFAERKAHHIFPLFEQHKQYLSITESVEQSLELHNRSIAGDLSTSRAFNLLAKFLTVVVSHHLQRLTLRYIT